jgi:hypothetical protein
MPTGTGIDAQLGLAEETTHGTAVAANRFLEFLSESLSMEVARLDSASIGAGRRGLRRWASGQRTVGGDLNLELTTKGLGVLLKHAIGSVATTGTTPNFIHTFTPGDLPPGLTVQVGRPSTDGTVRPFTYPGCQVASWGVSCSVGEIGQMTLNLTGQDETTATALATRTAPTGVDLLTFTQGTLTVGGTAIPVSSADFTVDNGLTVDRWQLGSALRRVPLQTALRSVTGSFTAEFRDLALYTAYVNGTEATLSLVFAKNANEGLTVEANVRYDGTTPTVGGPDELAQEVPFRGIDNGSLFYRAVYRSTDATP